MPISHRLEIIKRALRQWDPIGVMQSLDEDRLRLDEYDSYAARLLKAVESGATGREIAMRLAAIRVDSMALGDRRPTEQKVENGPGWRTICSRSTLHDPHAR